MGAVTEKQRFHGTVVLTILHLRRLAKSNDIEEGFAAARDLHMIEPSHEEFMRRCLALDEQIQADGDDGEYDLPELSRELQACVLRINSADPA